MLIFVLLVAAVAFVVLMLSLISDTDNKAFREHKRQEEFRQLIEQGERELAERYPRQWEDFQQGTHMLEDMAIRYPSRLRKLQDSTEEHNKKANELYVSQLLTHSRNPLRGCRLQEGGFKQAFKRELALCEALDAEYLGGEKYKRDQRNAQLTSEFGPVGKEGGSNE